ncbi:MAG: hypothetical protein U0800_13570 [Isosphaeraceae bacterium]
MKSVSRAFCERNIPDQYTDGLPVPQELKDIAKIFVQLQEARHEADYNVGAQYSRLHAKNLVSQARLAFDLWKQIREDPAIRMYAAGLLVKPRSR